MTRTATALLLVVLRLTVCSGQLTAIEQDQVLEVHNALRGEVHPQAANMIKLEYDDELSAVAQRHADACHWAPNTEALASYPQGLGENMAFRFGSDAITEIQPTRFVHEWFAESSFFNFTSGYCAPKETCSHYMQLVTARSGKVGCGLADCENFHFLGMLLNNATFFVCHYTPRGVSTPGYQPYTEGEPCSSCPSQLTACENKLCTVAPSAGNSTANSSTQSPTDAGMAIETTSETRFIVPDFGGGLTVAPVEAGTTEREQFVSSPQGVEASTTVATGATEVTTEAGTVRVTSTSQATTTAATTDSKPTESTVAEISTTLPPTAAVATTAQEVQTTTAAPTTTESKPLATTEAAETTEPATSLPPTTEAAVPTSERAAETSPAAIVPTTEQAIAAAETSPAAIVPTTEQAIAAAETSPAAIVPTTEQAIAAAETSPAAIVPTTEQAIAAAETSPAAIVPTTEQAIATAAATTTPPALTFPDPGVAQLLDPVTDNFLFSPVDPTASIPSLLPNKCLAPANNPDRQDCWLMAWVLWSGKYSQWTAGKCVGQAGRRPLM